MQPNSAPVEYLYPRMEVGLLHAEITQKMCDAWMSTIIYTICSRGAMSGSHNINRKAFCLLSGIPDLWMRTQISRATDLLINLNSAYGDHGRSTRSRLFNLTKTADAPSVINFLRTKQLKARKFFRMIPTLKFLQHLDIQLAITLEPG